MFLHLDVYNTYFCDGKHPIIEFLLAKLGIGEGAADFIYTDASFFLVTMAPFGS